MVSWVRRRTTPSFTCVPAGAFPARRHVRNDNTPASMRAIKALNARGPRILLSEATVACHVERMGRWQIGLIRMADVLFMDVERIFSNPVP